MPKTTLAAINADGGAHRGGSIGSMKASKGGGMDSGGAGSSKMHWPAPKDKGTYPDSNNETVKGLKKVAAGPVDSRSKK